ncbi:DUF2235 domain-containing protein [Winogradskyella sp.]|uniref:DUF2235 domain-containing protein n=1 Tax=Winogradskyella sp. TaxID=1883156 RepID=UPI003BA8C5F5
MPKNIIICCDGTGNKFGNSNSNVVKLYSVIKKIPDRQIAYYDPGVGTHQYSGVVGLSLKSRWRQLLGLATGHGLYNNIYEAYSFLMENYVPGDKVFLFGFSRGAYTVRVLSGFIYFLGLIEKGNQNLIPYAFEIYSKKKPKWDIARRFKKQYSRECPIEFMGIWDTVSSVGFFWNWKTYPYTANNKNIRTIKHAVAIDERRAFYVNNRLGLKHHEGQSVKEVWFPGVHSDVGGSYPEADSGLSKIALQWMVHEAMQETLLVDQEKYDQVVLGNDSNYVAPDPNGKLHKSLHTFWYLLEIIPKKRVIDYAKRIKRWCIPWGRYRTIPERSFIHESYFQRKNNPDYDPPNIPEDHRRVETAPIDW